MNKNLDSLMDIDFLTESERKNLEAVLSRNEKLNQKENERLRRLSNTSFSQSNLKENRNSQSMQDNLDVKSGAGINIIGNCSSCGRKFSVLPWSCASSNSNLCGLCKSKMCKKCTHHLDRPNLQICKSCHKNVLFEAKSGKWFFNNREIIENSYESNISKEKWRDKMNSYSREFGSADNLESHNHNHHENQDAYLHPHSNQHQQQRISATKVTPLRHVTSVHNSTSPSPPHHINTLPPSNTPTAGFTSPFRRVKTPFSATNNTSKGLMNLIVQNIANTVSSNPNSKNDATIRSEDSGCALEMDEEITSDMTARQFSNILHSQSSSSSSSNIQNPPTNNNNNSSNKCYFRPLQVLNNNNNSNTSPSSDEPFYQHQHHHQQQQQRYSPLCVNQIPREEIQPHPHHHQGVSISPRPVPNNTPPPPVVPHPLPPPPPQQLTIHTKGRLDNCMSDSISSLFTQSGVSITSCAGEILMSLLYDDNNSVLNITIHKCRNLISADPTTNCINPYIIVYFKPNRKKSNKQKTRTHFNSNDPVFEEYFMMHVDINSFETLVLLLCHKNEKTGKDLAVGQLLLLPEDIINFDVMNKWFSFIKLNSMKNSEASSSEQTNPVTSLAIASPSSSLHNHHPATRLTHGHHHHQQQQQHISSTTPSSTCSSLQIHSQHPQHPQSAATTAPAGANMVNSVSSPFSDQLSSSSSSNNDWRNTQTNQIHTTPSKPPPSIFIVSGELNLALKFVSPSNPLPSRHSRHLHPAVGELHVWIKSCRIYSQSDSHSSDHHHQNAMATTPSASSCSSPYDHLDSSPAKFRQRSRSGSWFTGILGGYQDPVAKVHLFTIQGVESKEISATKYIELGGYYIWSSIFKFETDILKLSTSSLEISIWVNTTNSLLNKLLSPRCVGSIMLTKPSTSSCSLNTSTSLSNTTNSNNNSSSTNTNYDSSKLWQAMLNKHNVWIDETMVLRRRKDKS